MTTQDRVKIIDALATIAGALGGARVLAGLAADARDALEIAGRHDAMRGMASVQANAQDAIAELESTSAHLIAELAG